MCVMQKVSILSDFFSGDRKKRCSSVDKFFWFFCGILQASSWDSEAVIKVPNKKVEGWALPEMPGQEFSRLPSQPLFGSSRTALSEEVLE